MNELNINLDNYPYIYSYDDNSIVNNLAPGYNYYNACVQSNSFNPGLETRNGMNLQKDEIECGKIIIVCETIVHRIISEAFPSCIELIGKADECV